MKSKISILLLLILGITVGCKNDKAAEAPAEEAKPAGFTVEVTVATDKPDDFALFYTEDGTIAFTPDKAVWTGVKPGEQTAVLTLPAGVVPTHIRLDLGAKQNQDQGNVTVKGVKLVYKDKEFAFAGSDFLKYFIKDAPIQFVEHPEAKSVEFKQNLESHTAFFYPQQALIDQISIITQ